MYGAPLEEVDFAGATEAARGAINSWVAKQTRDKIKDLIQPGILSTDSRLVFAAVRAGCTFLRFAAHVGANPSASCGRDTAILEGEQLQPTNPRPT